MATKVVMEALSPTMEEGRLVRWLRNEGDQVARGDVLAEVETDKAVMELVARGDGVLRARLAAEGDTSAVGSLLAVIAAPDENIDAITAGAPGGAATPPGAGAAAPSAGDATRQPASAVGAGPAEGVIANANERAGASSVPRAPQEAQGESSMPPQEKTPAGRMGNAAPKHQPPPLPEPSTERPPHARENGDEKRPRSSPLARRLASERGLDLENVRGSGPGGRIIRRDIEAALSGAVRARAEPSAAPPPVRPPTPAAGAGDFRDVRLTQIIKTIA